MKVLNILIACEESQRISTAFRELGHNAFSCDLQECSGGHPEFHIMADCIPLLNGKCEFKTCDGQIHRIDGKWDLIIAHPPCTFFSVAGANWLYRGGELNQDRYNKGLEMKKLFMGIYNADCDHIAIENPTPMRVFELPPYTQVIQPWMFSDGTENFTKRTCLWLKGLPNLIPSVMVKPEDCRPFVSAGSNTYRNGIKVKRGHRGFVNGSKERSKTFNGIAKTIADQYSQYITSRGIDE